MGDEYDPLVGQTIGKYVLRRIIGRGAMGMVYLAQDSETGQDVAVKFLAGEFATKDEFVIRFKNEAQACSSLDHPNIIRVFDVGEEGGTYYMVMEYVDGKDLGYYLKVQDKLKESQTLPWLKQSARALGYAHQHGIVHRDLKPENIMITKEGEVKIADLGLSKNLGTDEEMSMTMSGTVIGTPYYISPEQARDAKRVDARSDIYSLGATFYHLVTGQVPFEGNSAAEVMANHMNKTLVNPQRLNHALGDGVSSVIEKMMQKEQSNRFQTMEEVAEAIERVERGETAISARIKLKRRDSGVEEGAKTGGMAGLPGWARPAAAGVFALLLLLGWIFIRQPAGTHGGKDPRAAAVPVAPVKPPSKTPDGAPGTSHGTGTDGSATNETGGVEQPAQTGATGGTAVVVAPPGVKPPAAGGTGGDGVDETAKALGLSSTSAGPIGELRSGSLNWADGFSLVMIILGIAAARQVGTLWGVLRAVCFWGIMYLVFNWFEPVVDWFYRDIQFSMSVSAFFGLSALLLALLVPAWVFTQRLKVYEKGTEKNPLDRLIAVVPGFFIGMVFSVFFMTYLSFILPSGVPIAESLVGSWSRKTFPVISKMVEKARQDESQRR
ncbi:MAG: protein kinase [Verrucomicrobiae bacterium]|nr:protein kinase [Verrucomicrobiae bacterium]